MLFIAFFSSHLIKEGLNNNVIKPEQIQTKKDLLE